MKVESKPELGQWYRESRLRIVDLVSAGPEDLVVPGTPEWTVHDVVAHLAGTTEDAVTGNLKGVSTDPWTAAQVERGRSKTLAELIAMWDEYAPLIEGFLSSPEGGSVYRAVIDVVTHEADLLNARGRSVGLPGDVLAWAGDIARRDFAEGVQKSGLPPVDVRTNDFEWFRGRLGRRTEEEVCAYEWSANPRMYLDQWFIFGRATRSIGERSRN